MTPRRALVSPALAGLALAGLLAGCASSPSSGSPAASGQAAAAMSNPNLDTGTSLGGVAAPDIRLTNQFGQPMSLSQLHGKVVMLSF